jgi:GT2 family glycosyltransferase
MSGLPTRPPVVVAISSFRNDAEVERLLERAAPFWPSVFDRVIVVDSLPTGQLSRTIAAAGWEFVDYHAFDENLGSAGNLAQRLKIAASTDAKYVYAINHDGSFEPEVIDALVAQAETTGHVGAIYPLRRMTRHGGRYDLTGVRRVPPPFVGRRLPPESAVTEVYWSSSNPALYALDPVRAGLAPWGDLWMGWEDLGYGWQLHQHGYRQLVLTEAVVDDTYEYRSRSIGQLAVRVSDKPLWYTYYRVRNLILIARRAHPGLTVQLGMAVRVALELVLAVALRKRKRERLAMFAAGVLHGLRGVAGKWRLP